MTNKKNRTNLLSFLTPILLFIIIIFLLRIYPFGDKTLLTLDLNGQYISFFSYLKEIFQDPSALFYSFSKTLGGENFGLISYYGLSPFNLISLFFSTKNLPIAVTIITLLKIGFAGFSFNYFLNSKKLSSILFSTSFALMSFFITYYSNLPWLDSIVLLPIIARGIDKIIIDSKPILYVMSLAFSIIFNYYIGFMLCIFSFIYFMYKLLLSQSLTKKQVYKIILNYVLSSLIAVGISSIILIPTYYSLQSNRQILDFTRFDLTLNMNFFDILSKLVIGSFNFNEIINGFPNIFCGSLIIITNIMYFSSTSRSWREKFLSSLVILVFIASFIIQPLNLIWHAFSEPNWFPYRYSFILCFFLIYFGFLGFTDFKCNMVNKKYFLISSLFYVLVIGILFIIPYSYISNYKIIFTMLLTLVLVVLILLNKPKLLYLIVALELVLNGYLILSEFKFESFNEYETFVEQNLSFINDAKEMDNDFYRLEKTYYRSHNDPYLLGYNGISHNSSAESNLSRYYLSSKLGFAVEDNWVHYNTGTTYANDSLLGIKYLITDQELSLGYVKLKSENGINFYENIYPLPLGVIVSNKANNIQLQDFSWFNNQNEIWKSLSFDNTNDIMKSLELNEIRLHNVIQKNTELLSFESNGDEPYIELSVTPLDDSPIYLYMTSSNQKQVEISANNEPIGNYFTYGQNQILRVGEFVAGEELLLKIKLLDQSLDIDYLNIFYQDMHAFEQYFQEITNNSLDITKLSQGFISGNINATKDGILMFNIPYDQGWKIKLDGKTIKAVPALDIFISIPIQKGNHTISLYFLPRGVIKGSIISLISIIILILYIRFAKKFFIG